MPALLMRTSSDPRRMHVVSEPAHRRSIRNVDDATMRAPCRAKASDVERSMPEPARNKNDFVA